MGRLRFRKVGERDRYSFSEAKLGRGKLQLLQILMRVGFNCMEKSLKRVYGLVFCLDFPGLKSVTYMYSNRCTI